MNDSIVTTSWDDGHVLDLKLAGLLSQYDLPATFYIAPENRQIEKNKRLTAEQVRGLSVGPRFEIGAHTMTHPRLSAVTDAVAQDEIRRSKETLEAWTNKDVVGFCYPSGDYGVKHKQMVKDVGFSFARTTKRFSRNIGNDPFEMPTTIQAYRHWSDVMPILHESGVLQFPTRYLNWDELAIAVFDKIFNAGGVFHLWGHSWEIEKNNDWGRLERVFAHIGKRPGVRYLKNKELL